MRRLLELGLVIGALAAVVLIAQWRARRGPGPPRPPANPRS